MKMEEQLVWVPSLNDAYILAKIIDIRADSAVVETFEGNLKVTVRYASILRADSPSKPDVDDNCSLLFLNEASLLDNIRRRYFAEKIYTYVGNILIALNPYKQIPKLYDVACIRAYNGQSLGVMPPHVFAIADNAYRSMKSHKASQALIVSGESGAGKTECTKHILRYLTENWGTRAGPVEKRILDSNPLLEAFGNAKTRRNNNSSRFGKFIELHFSSANQVAGAHISHYLLEKSRICFQNEDERNYHIFYQMCAGLTDKAFRQELGLGPPSQFAYMRKGCAKFFRKSASSGGDFLKDDLLDDSVDFARTYKAMGEMGLSGLEKDVFRILSAVLHLGNVEFEENDKDRTGGCAVSENSSTSISYASKFFGVGTSALAEALTTRVIRGARRESVCGVSLSPTAARNARDALAKTVYSRLFDFVVASVNSSLPFDSSSASQFIGVLDIAGFEYFDINSFEQFCVNFCNERLQQFFTQRVLKAEQELYEREGLSFKRIQFIDNEDCIELLDLKPNGIFCLMDEESKFPKPSSEHFTQEVHKRHTDHFRLCVPRKSKLKSHLQVRDEEGFVIRHYAGAVCYHTAHFLDKNNDALHASLEALIQSSSSKVLQKIFNSTSQQGRQGSAGKLGFVSISAKFRSQLQVLIEKLQATGTHFIRCVKPNAAMSPKMFEAASVLSQLQASGMTEALRLMQQGYPSRVNFADFYALYKSKLPASLAKLDPRLFCRALCKAVGMKEGDFTFGPTKVFFRSGRFAEFDKIVRSDADSLKKLIDSVRHWIVKERWRKAQFFVWSGVKFRRRMAYRKGKAIFLQKMVRGFLARRKFAVRIEALHRLNILKQRLTQDTVAKSVEKLKDAARKQTDSEVSSILKSLDNLIGQVKNTSVKIDSKKLTSVVNQKAAAVESLVKNVEKRLREQNARDAELEKLKKLEAEMAAAKLKREKEEAEAKARLEKQKAEEEAARKIEAEKQEKLKALKKPTATVEAEDAKLAKSLQEEIDREESDMKKQKALQEKLDRELALRVANGNQDATNTEEESAQSSKAASPTTKRKFDVANWKYADLRDTINTSCDIELIEECRQEFHRRLRIYHEWKMRNRHKNETAVSSAQERMPGSVMSHALQTSKEQNQDQSASSPALSKQFNTPIKVIPAGGVAEQPYRVSSSGARQRYFRLPLKQFGPRGSTYTTGWWLAHFDGQWIARQLELRDGSHPTLKLAGVDDMTMCEFNLSETGLEGRPDAEIAEHQFEYEWNRNYGLEYLMSHSGMVSSTYIKARIEQIMHQPGSR